MYLYESDVNVPFLHTRYDEVGIRSLNKRNSLINLMLDSS